MYKFKIPPIEQYLEIEVEGYYHDAYHAGDNRLRRIKGTVENIITVLKNSFGTESQETLDTAKYALKNILKRELKEIPRLTGKNSLIVCVIPRAKKLSAYSSNQLFFKKAVSEALVGLNQLFDGTDYIKRHTNTRTTHLNRSGNGGDGDLPYPGITSETCYISERVIGKDIILVDDLYTKTVNIDEDAIQALLDRGAESVTFYSLGKTFNPEYAEEQKDQKVILSQTTLNVPNKYQQTYHLILEGKNLQQIIQIRGLTQETIIKHIYEIAKIKGSSIATNFKPRVEIIEAVRTAVNSVGSNEKLRPIYDDLRGEVSWNDIRLSLIFI